jgi:hypothetical protein
MMMMMMMRMMMIRQGRLAGQAREGNEKAKTNKEPFRFLSHSQDSLFVRPSSMGSEPASGPPYFVDAPAGCSWTAILSCRNVPQTC